MAIVAVFVSLVSCAAAIGAIGLSVTAMRRPEPTNAPEAADGEELVYGAF